MDLRTDERRTVIQIIATLVHVKSTMVEKLLKPAGVPVEIYRPLFSRRDEATGKLLTKRQMAPLILDALEVRPDCSAVARRLIEIATQWTEFHLAEDEFQARATVQKAREVLGTIQVMEAREAEEFEKARQEEIRQREREQTEVLRRELPVLLAEYERRRTDDDAPQARGYALQGILERLFAINDIPVRKSFTRNQGGEQIDGAFYLDGWHYLVECRWRKKLTDIRELDGLNGQVVRSGKQAMGLFLSINGWSEHVPTLLKQNPDKSIMLMEGYGLRLVLTGDIKLRDYLLAMAAHLGIKGEPFLSAQEYLEQHGD